MGSFHSHTGTARRVCVVILRMAWQSVGSTCGKGIELFQSASARLFDRQSQTSGCVQLVVISRDLSFASSSSSIDGGQSNEKGRISSFR